MKSDRHVLNNSSIYVKGEFWPMSPCMAFFLNNEWRFLEEIVPVIREAQGSHCHFRSSFVHWPWCPRESKRPWSLYSSLIQSSGGMADSMGKCLGLRCEVCRQTLVFSCGFNFSPLSQQAAATISCHSL